MEKTSLIEFPCEFPIKIVGIHTGVFVTEIKDIVRKHYPDLAKEKFTFNASKNDKFLAITAIVLAQNQEGLDALYKELSQHPLVKMVL